MDAMVLVDKSLNSAVMGWHTRTRQGDTPTKLESILFFGFDVSRSVAMWAAQLFLSLM